MTEDTQPFWKFLHKNDHSIMFQLFLNVLAYISLISPLHSVQKKISRAKNMQINYVNSDKTKQGLSLENKA